MATIQLTDPYFYKAGKGGVTRVVGVESKVTRVARYSFTAPAAGASHIDLAFDGFSHSQGEAIALRYHITESPDSYADPTPSDPYTGTLTMNAALTAATGSADVLLLPGKTYYLWVFPAVLVWGWYSWILEGAALTTSGGSVSGLSAQSGTLGSALSIAITRYAAFTHKVTWAFGSKSGTVATAAATSCSWTPPLSLAAEIPNAVSGMATLTCYTYDGDTLIGQKSISVKLSVPESLVPSVSAAWEDTTGAAAKMGSPVQNISKLSVEITAAGAYGSTIVSRAVKLGGKTYTGSVLTASGAQTLSVTVTDSRGRSAVWSQSLSVLAYSPPSLTLTAHRCDASGNADEAGEYAEISVTGAVTALTGNTAALTLTAGSTHTPAVSPGSVSYSVIVEAPSVSTLTIEAKLSDALTATSRAMVLSVGYATLDLLAGGKGIAFGTSASKEGFTCAMDTDMSGRRLYNLGAPQSDSDAAPMSMALPYRGTVTGRDTAKQGVYRYGSGILVHLGDGSNALQLQFSGSTLTARACINGTWA